MDEFKFLNDLEGRIFCTNLSELEERLDPLFYIAVKNIKENIVNKAKYECVDLIKICTINRGRFGHRPRNDPRFYDGQYPFIQTGDIVKAAEGNASIEYTQTLNELGLKTSNLFEPPKLLFTIAANIGDTAILDYPSCFPDSIVALIPNKNNLSLEYLNTYLGLIKAYVVELAPYSAQRNLNNQQLAQVPVIIPPKDIQESIVLKMDLAYSAKKQKEAEAQQLLDSIDDYLLAELGIELPEQKENTLKSRIFTQQFKNIMGKRLDPIFYYSDLNKFNSGGYDSLLLRAVSLSFISGVGAGKQDQAEELDGIIQIRPTNIDRNGALKYDKNIYLPKDFQGVKIEVDNVLFNNTNSQELVGKTTILKEEKELFFSNHITKIKVNTRIIYPDYLAIILNAYQRSKIFYSICTNWNNQSGIGLDVLKSLKIPVPPLKKQTKIADHITETRNQAKQLQQQAKTELEQAKKQVEAMILGEA